MTEFSDAYDELSPSPSDYNNVLGDVPEVTIGNGYDDSAQDVGGAPQADQESYPESQGDGNTPPPEANPTPGPDSDSEQAAAPGDVPPPVPPELPPAFAEGGDSEPPTGESADRKFNDHVVTFPTITELNQLKEKEKSIDWCVTTRSPLATTFGGESSEPEERMGDLEPPPDSRRLAPEQPEEIVDRQLTGYGTTLTRLQDGIKATADLAELTDQHAGRTLITEYKSDGLVRPRAYYTEGYAITPSPDGSLAVDEPQTKRPDSLLLHKTSSGEVHLVNPNATHRIIISNDNGELDIRQQDASSVRPTDAGYFDRLNKNLTTYRDMLLEVADQAGFNRASIVDPISGQVNMAYVLGTVDPKISNPAFQASLPSGLRTKLEVYCQAIASKVNATYSSEESIVQKGFRLSLYFRSALGRKDS